MATVASETLDHALVTSSVSLAAAGSSFIPEDIIASTVITILSATTDTPLQAIVTTPRLIIRPVIEKDVSFYQERLWGDKTVMEKFADGEVRLYKDTTSRAAGLKDYAQDRIVNAENSWCKRWQRNNPWSGMTVCLRGCEDPIGHIVIGGGELAYFLIPGVWRNHYASEAAVAMVNVLVPELVQRSDFSVQPPLTIEATVRIDHVASQKVLSYAGLMTDKVINEREFSGKKFQRYIYKATVAELVKRYAAIKAKAAHVTPLIFSSVAQQSSGVTLTEPKPTEKKIASTDTAMQLGMTDPTSVNLGDLPRAKDPLRL